MQRSPIRSAPRLALILLLAVVGPAESELNRWTSHGPYGGDIFSLTIDPQDTSSILAGTSVALDLLLGSCAGIFHSSDGGATWMSRSSGLPSNGRCVNVLFHHPTQQNVVLAGTNLGLFRSSDGGPWQRSGLAGQWILDVVFDAGVPHVFYAATASYATGNPGLFRSDDGGSTWADISSGLPDTPGLPPRLQTLAIDLADPDVLYAGASEDGGAFRSVDGGDSWALISDGLPSFADIRSLVIRPGNPSTVLAATRSGLFRWNAGATSWIPDPGGLADTAISWLTAAPNDPSILYASAGDRLFHSSDGGDSWAPTAGRLHTPLWRVAVDPNDSDRLVAGTLDTGIFRSDDSGATWDPSERGPGSVVVTDIVATSTDEDPVLYAVSRDGVFRSDDGGSTWMPRNNGLTGRYPRAFGPRILESLSDLVVDPVDPSILYLANSSEAGVFRSIDGGTSWEPGGLKFFRIQDLAIVTNTDGVAAAGQPTLFAATTGLWRSTDRGETWERVLESGTSVLAVSSTTTEAVYAAEGTRLWRSADGGDTWTMVAENGPRIRSLAIDPADPFTLIAGTDDAGILHSTDGGVSWAQTLGDVGNTRVDALVFGPGDPPALYAGTRGRGAYRSVDGGLSWWRLPGAHPGDVGALAVTTGSSTRGTSIHLGTLQGVSELRLVPTLELQGERFQVTAEWREFGDVRGTASVASIAGAAGPSDLRSVDSAVLEFFDQENWELLIKILDGRALTDHFWIFFAATTDVEYELTVVDTSCGSSKTYSNPLGRASPAVTDTEALPGCLSPGPPDCQEVEGILCLGPDGRFRVEVGWRDFTGGTGAGRQVRVPEGELAESDDSGLLYFFGERNWELLVKVLDGCSFNDRFWVFSAATTDVEYRLTITDTLTGEVRAWFNPLGVDAPAVTDTAAFATCLP